MITNSKSSRITCKIKRISESTNNQNYGFLIKDERLKRHIQD